MASGIADDAPHALFAGNAGRPLLEMTSAAAAESVGFFFLLEEAAMVVAARRAAAAASTAADFLVLLAGIRRDSAALPPLVTPADDAEEDHPTEPSLLVLPLVWLGPRRILLSLLLSLGAWSFFSMLVRCILSVRVLSSTRLPIERRFPHVGADSFIRSLGKSSPTSNKEQT